MKKQKPKKKSVAKKTKPAPKPAKKKPTKKIATAKVAAQKTEETMERTSLKTIVAQLKEMGSDIKVFKSDSDEALQKKVNEALQKLPTADMLKKLESIVPDKLVSVLKKDCLGIFIDLSDVSCIRCPDNMSCAKTFIQNLKGGMKGVDGAAGAKPVEEKKAPKASITPVSRYEAGRLVFMRDRKNPNAKDDPWYDTVDVVLKEQPDTLGAVREIVERDFEVESDGEFMKLVASMRDPKEGILKLDVDLSKDDREALREAGYDV